jgi:hypothetical protein
VSLDSALEDASTSLRSTPIVAPPPFPEVLGRRQRQRRRSQFIVTAGAVVFVVIGLVTVLTTTGRDTAGVVAGDPPTSIEPAVPMIRGAGLDVVGSGAFRLTGRPGALEDVTDHAETDDEVEVLDKRLRRVSDLTATDATGNQYRVESFEATADIAPWLVGQLPAGVTPVAIGPRRVAAFEHTDSAAALTWAYDAQRAVRVSVTPADGTSPTPELVADVAGSVLAADRLPRPDAGPHIDSPADVTGLPYLEAEQVLLDEGHTVRIGVEISAGFEGPSTVVGVAPYQRGPRSVLVATARTAPGKVAAMIDANGIPAEPEVDEFIPVAGEHGYAGFIHARDFGYLPTNTAAPTPPDTSVFPTIAMLPDGEIAGTWDQGFVALDVLLDPDADPGDVNPDLRTPPSTEQRYRDGVPTDGAPYDPAPDWVSIELGGVEISVPPTWTIVEANTCPIPANSLIIGDPGGCALPGTDAAWIHIRELPDDLADLGDFPRTCLAGAVNGAESCRIETSTERMTFNGTDAFLEISYGTPRTNLGDITNTIRVAGTPTGSPNMEPINVARSWVEASYAGNCATMFDLASTELRAGRTPDQFETDCRAAHPTDHVTFVSAHTPAAGPTGATAIVTMTTSSGQVVEHHLRLAHHFDPEIRSTRWSVAATDGT